MQIEDYSKYFMYGGIVISLLVCVMFYFMARGDKTDIDDIVGVKTYLARSQWEGVLSVSKIESWKQNNIKYGNDFFYDIYFYLPGSDKLCSAKALVEPSHMHLMRKGLKIEVKRGAKGHLAVMEIAFDDQSVCLE